MHRLKISISLLFLSVYDKTVAKEQRSAIPLKGYSLEFLVSVLTVHK